MRRWLRTIMLFLLLGAVVNVGVAWGIARWANMGGYQFSRRWFLYGDVGGVSREGYPAWHIVMLQQPGLTVVFRGPTDRDEVNDEVDVSVHLPDWSRAHSPPSILDAGDLFTVQYCELAFGWPMKSMMYESSFVTPARQEAYAGGFRPSVLT